MNVKRSDSYTVRQLARLAGITVRTLHHAWIENFYPAPAELYRGLGQMYVEHPEFRAFYEKYRPGLAEFMQAAMAHYADTALAR